MRDIPSTGRAAQIGDPFAELQAQRRRLCGAQSGLRLLIEAKRVVIGVDHARAVARGAIDLGESRYNDVRLGVDLLRPQALFDNLTGRNVRMVWTLDGAFDTADYSYRLTSPGIKFDQTGLIDFRAEGRGRLSAWPMRVPIQLSAKAITGIGDIGGSILANPKIEGWLSLTPQMVRGDNLKLTSAKINGKTSVKINDKTSDKTSGNSNRTSSGSSRMPRCPRSTTTRGTRYAAPVSGFSRS